MGESGQNFTADFNTYNKYYVFVNWFFVDVFEKWRDFYNSRRFLFCYFGSGKLFYLRFVVVVVIRAIFEAKKLLLE